MAAHLYWRLNVSANNGSTNLAVAELGLYVAGGASSAATGGTASASTTNGAQTASLAFDASTSTYWQATLGITTGWLQYQFASAVDIAVYTVAARNDGNGPTQVPKAWTLEYSDDGSAWTVADTVARQTNWPQGETRYYTVGANAGTTAQGAKLSAFQSAKQVTPPSPNQVQLGKAPATAARTVSGTVKVEGVATGGLLVRAYAKITGEFIGQATSAGDGSYSINCGNVWADVYVVAFDPTTYQAVVFDQIVPG